MSLPRNSVVVNAIVLKSIAIIIIATSFLFIRKKGCVGVFNNYWKKKERRKKGSQAIIILFFVSNILVDKCSCIPINL